MSIADGDMSPLLATNPVAEPVLAWKLLAYASGMSISPSSICTKAGVTISQHIAISKNNRNC